MTQGGEGGSNCCLSHFPTRRDTISERNSLFERGTAITTNREYRPPIATNPLFSPPLSTVLHDILSRGSSRGSFDTNPPRFRETRYSFSTFPITPFPIHKSHHRRNFRSRLGFSKPTPFYRIEEKSGKIVDRGLFENTETRREDTRGDTSEADRRPSAVYQISAVNPVTSNPGARRRRIVKRKGGEREEDRGRSARIEREREALIAGRVMMEAQG